MYLSHLTLSEGCPQRERAKVCPLCPVWDFLKLGMSFPLDQAPRLPKAQATVSPQTETCWVREVSCLAWSFSKSGLGLPSHGQIMGRRLSMGGGLPPPRGQLGKEDRPTLRLLAATNLCFAERNVYTSEVLAVVMQQLMEQSPLPMLLMRTVIQSLTMYPRLGGFVMNILSRLIMKQVTCPGHPSPTGSGLQQDTLKTD